MNSLWDILSVAIGISFIFMILSILNSWIQDYIATALHLRANNLADIIQNLLEPGAEKLNGSRRVLHDQFPMFLGYSDDDASSEDETNGQEAGPDYEARFEQYTVQRGDTISRIAKKHRVSAADLQAANPRALGDLPLPTGSSLSIPYKVKDKDTLSRIAKKHKVSIAALQAANPNVLDRLALPDGSMLNIPNKAQPGEMLSQALSSIAERLKTSTTARQAGTPEGPDSTLQPDGSTLSIPYQVKDQDTLSSIAKEFKISTADLRAANPHALDRLRLPEESTLDIPYKAKDKTSDTWSSIAESFGLSIADLQAANAAVLEALSLPDGSTLHIPQRESKVSQLDNRNKQEILFKLRENPVMTLYTHPVVYSLSKPGQLPDRLPTNDFTVALLDLLDDAGRKTEKSANDVISMENIIEGIKNLETEEKRKDETDDQLKILGFIPLTTTPKKRKLAFRLRSLLYAAQLHSTRFNPKGEPQVGIEEFQKAVSEWFEDTVARGSVWYKRRMQRIGILCGFLLAIVLNADTIGLSNALWHNAMLRESVLQAAQASASQEQLASGEQAQQQLETLTNLGLPIGWSFAADPADPRSLPFTLEGWIGKAAGLLLTGFAISQGSQIWFDLMNRLLNVRSSGLQPAAEEHPAAEKKK